MSVLSAKHIEFINAYEAVLTELAKPELDPEAIDDLLADLKSAVCLHEDEDDDDIEPDAAAFAPPQPTYEQYESLREALEAREDDLDDFQKSLGRDTLLEVLECIEG